MHMALLQAYVETTAARVREQG